MDELGQKQLKNTEAASTRELHRGGPEYPALLERLPDPPDHLFVRGEVPLGPMVAIVGSRKADQATKRFVFRLAGELTAHGVTILSGGAQGIDTAAHEGALDAGGLTVAVIGSGFDFMYPAANEDLFRRVSQRGALMTEFAPPQPPTKWTFPRRNRIVAAMAGAVVVAQAGERSGALITARNARDLGVGLGVIPGMPGDARNTGSHQLLRSGATFVENARDVLSLMERTSRPDQLNLPGVVENKSRQTTGVELSDEMNKLLDLLGRGPVHIDSIIADTGLSPSAVSAALMSLEINGLIEDHGGKHFARIG